MNGQYLAALKCWPRSSDHFQVQFSNLYQSTFCKYQSAPISNCSIPWESFPGLFSPPLFYVGKVDTTGTINSSASEEGRGRWPTAQAISTLPLEPSELSPHNPLNLCHCGTWEAEGIFKLESFNCQFIVSLVQLSWKEDDWKIVPWGNSFSPRLGVLIIISFVAHCLLCLWGQWSAVNPQVMEFL